MNILPRVLVADPPWSFNDRSPGGRPGAEDHYPVLSQEEIESFPTPQMNEDALLFLWRVSSQPEEALAVVRAWGFQPKSELVWVKTRRAVQSRKALVPANDPFANLHFGMGRYTRMCHESCIIATRGKGHQLIRSHSVRSVLFAPVGRHSSKPDAFYDLVEELTFGPHVELFARVQRPNWTQYGNQLPGGLASPADNCANYVAKGVA